MLGLDTQRTSGKLHLTSHLCKECDESQKMANGCQIHASDCPRKMTEDDFYGNLMGVGMTLKALVESTPEQLSAKQSEIQALKNAKCGWKKIEMYRLLLS